MGKDGVGISLFPWRFPGSPMLGRIPTWPHAGGRFLLGRDNSSCFGFAI